MKPKQYRTKKGIRWEARWTRPDGSEGSKGAFLREKDAKKYAAEQVTGRRVDPSMDVKVSQWGERWLDAQGHQKPKTLHGYCGLWTRYVQPEWQDWTLTDIKPMDVDAWVNKLRRQGLSHSTTRQARQLLGAMLGAAVKNGYVMANPVMGKLPNPHRGEVVSYIERALSLEQVANLADVAAEDRHEDGVLILFMAASGLRFGEVRALKGKDLHLKNALPYPHLVVNAAVTDVNGPLWGTPKNHQRRTVYLPPSTVAKLESLQRGAQDLVFTAPKGGMLTPSNFRTRVVRWEQRAGLGRHVRLHDLRHTCGTLMANAGVPMVQVKEHLGHSQMSTTEKYVRSQPFGEQASVGSLKDWLEADWFDVPLGNRDETGMKNRYVAEIAVGRQGIEP